MKEKLQALLKEAPLGVEGFILGHTIHRKGVEAIADHLLANGVIVPPCKVGDTVYRLDDLVLKSDCEECEHFEEGWYDCPCECAKTRSTKKHHKCIEIKEDVVSQRWLLHYLSFELIGKTVFLTREEAEAALAEREGKG